MAAPETPELKLIPPVSPEWDNIPMVSDLREQMFNKAWSDWAKILQAAGVGKSGTIDGVEVLENWRLNSKLKLTGKLLVNGIRVQINCWDRFEWGFEAVWKLPDEWTCSDYLYNQDLEWFVEFCGDPSPEVMRFLNVTDACLKNLNSYWNCSKGRSIEQFIEDCLEEHGDGFGPTSWRSKPAVA